MYVLLIESRYVVFKTCFNPQYMTGYAMEVASFDMKSFWGNSTIVNMFDLFNIFFQKCEKLKGKKSLKE